MLAKVSLLIKISCLLKGKNQFWWCTWIADGNDGMKAGSCPNRDESPPMNTLNISLVLQNYFPTNPNESQSCADNSAPLISMMETCYQADGKRWPNFIAVDFYQVLAYVRVYMLSINHIP